jgi:hypothetical protein
VLPIHPAVPNGGTAAADGRHGRIRALVLAGLALGILAWVADGTAGLAVVLGMTALGAAGYLGMRSGRVGARPDADGPILLAPASMAADDESVTPDELTERLRRLYDDHVEQVNMALSEDREDLVQELSDSYMDQALRLITAGARPSPETLPIR